MYEIELSVRFNRDRILKNTLDQSVRGQVVLLAGHNEDVQERIQNNLVFILDSSTSMNDQYYDTGNAKRDAVVKAVRSLVDDIDNNDTVSIVSFNSIAVLHADHVSGGEQDKINSAVDLYMKDKGGTDFEKAMIMAESVINAKRGNYKLFSLRMETLHLVIIIMLSRFVKNC